MAGLDGQATPPLPNPSPGSPSASPPASGRGAKRREPRWVIAFLRALERTGEARAAAADAGVDHSTAYARRRVHADFALAWDGALRAHKEAKARGEAEEIASFDKLRMSGAGISPPLPSAASRLPPSPAEGGGAEAEELVVSGGQVKRAGAGRWSQAKEKIFFEELAATANARAAAAAVGMSKNAVLQRRLRHPVFAAKWDAVVATSKASINLYLLEASNQTFDPDMLDTGEVTPKVTIDQAIKISQLGGAKKQEPATDPFDDPSASYQADIADVRERLVKKLQAMRRRDRPDKLARGWSYDESWDIDIPPGWIKGPDWRPMQPGEEY
jgi:hypothetical protein